jgi:hypothetical protein
LKLRKIVGKQESSLFYPDNLIDNSNVPSTTSLSNNDYVYEPPVEDIEKELIFNLQQWLGSIS